MFPSGTPAWRNRLGEVGRRSWPRKFVIPAWRTAGTNQWAFTLRVSPARLRNDSAGPFSTRAKVGNSTHRVCIQRYHNALPVFGSRNHRDTILEVDVLPRQIKVHVSP